MKYLKIFLKWILVLSLIFTFGCVSDDNSILTEVSVPDIDPVVPIPELVKEPGIVPAIPEVVKFEKAIVDNITWTEHEIDNQSFVVMLPVVDVRPKVKELIQPSSYSGFHNMALRAMEREISPASVTITESKDMPASESRPVSVNMPEKIIQPQQAIDANVVTVEDSKKTIVTERSMSVFLKDKLEITLPARGWIYLPEKDNSSLEYSGRQFRNENTIYTFIPKLEGFFVLHFQFQDLINNIYTIEKINLTVSKSKPDEDNKSVAVISAVQVYQASKPEDLETTFRNLLSANDVHGILNLVPDLVRSTDPSIQSLLPEAAELLFSSSYYVPSALILETLVKDKSFIGLKDRFLYLLGKIYEEDSKIQNELISAKYYKLLLDTYPASVYWEEAQGRYRFLKRRYIDIR